MSETFAYSNALTRTLAYYENELVETLARRGVEVVRNDVATVEGRSGISGKLGMLADSIRNDLRFRDRADINLQVWPSLGLIEALLWRSARRRDLLMVHDPIPLRGQAGYGSLSRALARSWFPRSSAAPTIVVHSDDAERVVRQMLPQHDVIRVLHPVRSKMRVTAKSAQASVVVAGQNKEARDLHMLGALGPQLRRRGVELKILGRGWPNDLPGWDVDSRFIPEDEFDRALGEAWVVLLPYRRYFQSGVALRALENGTEAVSPRTSFAEDLLKSSPGHIIDAPHSEEQWLVAISRALESAHDREAVGRAFASYLRRCDDSWSGLLASRGNERCSGR